MTNNLTMCLATFTILDGQLKKAMQRLSLVFTVNNYIDCWNFNKVSNLLRVRVIFTIKSPVKVWQLIHKGVGEV